MLQGSNHLRIGIVDDDLTILSLLNELLTEEGFVVTTFSDGMQVQKAAHQNPFDIILTDINMPECSGIELLRYLREELHADTEVIIMTANVQVDTAIQAVRLGAFDYLQKPFEDVDAVVQLVHRAAEKILFQKRQDELVNLVIEKTKTIISTQKELPAGSADLPSLISRTESYVKNLQTAAQEASWLGEAEQRISGAVEEIGLANLLQLLGLVGKPGVLRIRGEKGEGLIWFSSGKMHHAQMGRVVGEKAVFRLLNQENGEFGFFVTRQEPPQSEIDQPTDRLILECLRQMDEFRELGPRVPPEHLFLRLKGAIPTVLPEEQRVVLEMVMRYSRIGDILDFSPYSDLKTVKCLVDLRLRDLLDIYLPKAS